ncbi:MAG: aminotransferase class V-fold PLP-dependent enzyme [Bacteroidales bacterium]|nr:aminotransferase class V-fold PLP-dependent enzyme [Bacteroidales bacterium]
MSDTQVSWSSVRDRIHHDPAVAMLNTGSWGLVPRSVFARVTALRQELAAGPTDFFLRRLPDRLWDAREQTARFLGTTPQRFVFSVNVSSAINLIAAGLPLAGPGEILMSDHEYGCMVWCWERAAKRRGLEPRSFTLPRLPSDPEEIVDAAVAAMTLRTKLLFFSHVLSPTGMVLPAKRLCAEARQRGILTVVDGAHAPGMLPLAVDDVGADFYTANLHKWLLAPTGAGFLTLGPGQEDRLEPLHVSWGYYADRYPIGDTRASHGPDDRDAYGSTPRTRFLEFEASRDICPWLVVPDAIQFQTELGWLRIRQRIAELAAYTRSAIGERFHLPLATPAAPDLHGAMTAFAIPDRWGDSVHLRRRLWEAHIEVPIIDRPDRRLLRVSHHFYTLEAEIDRLAAVLATLPH